IPLAFFGGIGLAAKKGVLVKGGNYLDALGKLDIVVFDKTGTLTKGLFQVTSLHPAGGFSGEELLRLAAQAEAFSNHPIALSILKAYDKPVDKEQLSGARELPGEGVSLIMDGKKLLAGSGRLMKAQGIAVSEPPGVGVKLHVSWDGLYAGCIVAADELKPQSLGLVAALKARGVSKTAMLSGDSAENAAEAAKKLSIDEVFAPLLPHEKVERLEELGKTKRPQGKLAFVGDGINDAPVLARADVGVAMGKLGADAAIEAADVALMNDDPLKLAEAMDISRTTKSVVWQNILFALGVKGIFLLLGALGLAGMPEAVFADVGVALLAILNSMRLLAK
ncbi:MAG: HAD-IC family P-type ATPase, partial [Clostridiales bacterium]|nr:HAD-IC family P-type ATPase [Clostridiales bacterium]